MAVFLPIIFFILLQRVFFLRQKGSLPLALLSAAVVMGAGTILVTEMLSFLKCVSYLWLVLVWLMADIVIGLQCLKLTQANNLPFRPKVQWPREITFWVMATALFIFIILPVSYTAFKAAPDTWDSMMYHLPRIEHWIENHNLEYYPTNIDRQLWKDYGSEILILHLRILSGADYLSNVVQLLAWFGCMLAGFAIMGLWKRSHWEKLLAIILMSTIPMAILQASSTQGDLIGSFWLMAFVFFVFCFLETKQKTCLILCGLALGNSVLTRETNYLYGWPFVCWLMLSECKLKHFFRVFEILGIILGGIILVNAGHYAKNIIFYHTLLSPPIGSESLVNEHWTVTTLIVNALRNTFMHLSTPLASVNDQILTWLMHWTKRIGVDLQDPSSMTANSFMINTLFLDEDFAQNPLHLFLLVILLIYTCLRWFFIRNKQDQNVRICTFALVLGMATFSLVLKWQPFHSRLHVGIFILSCLPAAVMIGSLRSRWFMVIVMLLFIVPSLLWVLRNDDRPLLGPGAVWRTARMDQYYYKRPIEASHDQMASDIFNKVSCDQVGLYFRLESWEYPFWVLMRQQKAAKMRIEQVQVGNDTERLSYPLGDFNPCGIYMQPSDGRQVITVGNSVYARIWETVLPDGSKSAIFLRKFSL